MAQKSTRCIAVFSLELHINFISHSYLTTTNRIPHLARLSSLLVPTSLFLWHFLSLLPVLLLSSKYLPLCLNPFWPNSSSLVKPLAPQSSQLLYHFVIPDCLPIAYEFSFTPLKLAHLRWAYLSLLKDRLLFCELSGNKIKPSKKN